MSNMKHILSINNINIIGIITLLLLALLFTALVVYEEYKDFNTEVTQLKIHYLKKKKEEIKNQTKRVIKFITYEYKNYRDTLDKEKLQQHIIDAINQLYTDLPANRYIFIYTIDGYNVFDPNRPEIKGKNMLKITDPTGIPILKELIQKAKNGGGYLYYQWEEPSTKQFSPKISYAEIFKPWNWLVGTGVYMGELENMVLEKEEEMKNRLIKYVMEILTLSAILFGFAFAGIKLINKIIQDEIKTFSEFFNAAATRYNVINKHRIKIKEFIPLASYVNHMVETIHQRNRELIQLNLSLEEKVRKKTAKLQQQKEYSEQLVKAQDAFIKTSIHEINTPLAIIMAQIDLLKMYEKDNRYIQKIEAAAKMIHNLYGDLSYLLRYHRIEYEKEPIDPEPFIRQRIDFFNEIAQSNRLSFKLILQKSEKVWLNIEEFTRLVDNNLSNAIKYALPGSEIVVRLCNEKDEIRLSFSNKAKEITNIEKLFEPFYQDSEHENGFGLGLYIVKRICERNMIGVTLQHNENVVTFTYIISKWKSNENPTA
ncbi:cache domain-containing protein [Hydrogenimonas thermophila]|nr:cache domain-containing protein [Hydrogenimonas thermophila]